MPLFSFLSKFKILPHCLCNCDCETSVRNNIDAKLEKIKKNHNKPVNKGSKPSTSPCDCIKKPPLKCLSKAKLEKTKKNHNKPVSKGSRPSPCDCIKKPCDSIKKPPLKCENQGKSSCLSKAPATFSIPRCGVDLPKCCSVGFLSLFITTSIMFWIAVAQRLWCLIKKLHQADGSIQLLALGFFLLFFASITAHAMNRSNFRMPGTTILKTIVDLHQSVSKHETLKETPSSLQQISCCTSNNNIETVDAAEFKVHCEKCDNANTFSQPPLSDDEIREMYKKYKLYSVASDMKFPPSFGHVFEVISGYLEG